MYNILKEIHFTLYILYYHNVMISLTNKIIYIHQSIRFISYILS